MFLEEVNGKEQGKEPRDVEPSGVVMGSRYISPAYSLVNSVAHTIQTEELRALRVFVTSSDQT